jgi:hypothetical protein
MMDPVISSIWDMQSNNYSSNEDEIWTEACLVERLKQHLATVKGQISANKKVHEDRKYYNLCYNFLLIGAYKSPKPFPVSVSDLSDKLLRELNSLNKDDRRYVLKQAVGQIFEDIDSHLYHNSISRVLEVLLVD